MSTLSFSSHYCSPRAPTVKASNARQVACAIRERQLACIFCYKHQVLTGDVLRLIAGFVAPAFHGNKWMRLDARHRWMNTLAIPSTPSSNTAVEQCRRWQTMSTLSFISDFCSSGELPVNSSDAQQLACFIRVRFYCGELQGFAELGGFELRDGGSVFIATFCRDWQGEITNKMD